MPPPLAVSPLPLKPVLARPAPRVSQSASTPPTQIEPPVLAPTPVFASYSGRSILATSLGYPRALDMASPVEMPTVNPDRRRLGADGIEASSSLARAGAWS